MVRTKSMCPCVLSARAEFWYTLPRMQHPAIFRRTELMLGTEALDALAREQEGKGAARVRVGAY